MSWRVREEDYRPLRDPPNDAILAWWCTGFSEVDSTLCGVVQADNEGAAMAAVLVDWPGSPCRFIQLRADDWVPISDRFPVTFDWARERLNAGQN